MKNYLDHNPGHDISSLRLVACGGSAVPISHMKACQERYDVNIFEGAPVDPAQ